MTDSGYLGSLSGSIGAPKLSMNRPSCMSITKGVWPASMNSPGSMPPAHKARAWSWTTTAEAMPWAPSSSEVACHSQAALSAGSIQWISVPMGVQVVRPSSAASGLRLRARPPNSRSSNASGIGTSWAGAAGRSRLCTMRGQRYSLTMVPGQPHLTTPRRPVTLCRAANFCVRPVSSSSA